MTAQKTLYFPALDGLRFFAFFLVFIRHVGAPPIPGGNFVWQFAWAGVDLFFLLTGFLFFVMLHEEQKAYGRIHYRAFYVRRVLRIMPLYFLYVTGAAIGLAMMGGTDVAARFAGYATFTLNLLSSFIGGDWRLPLAHHLWTIGYEEQVYLVLPLIISALLGAKQGRAVAFLLVAVVVGMALRAAAIKSGIGMENRGPYFVPFLRPESIIAGLLCGIAWTSGVYRRFSSTTYGLMFLVLVAALFGLTRLYGYDAFESNISISVYPILAAIFLTLTLYSLSPGSLFGRLISHPGRWLSFPWLGKISYGLYVYHPLSIYLATHWIIRPLDLPRIYGLRFAIALTITILLATLSYYLFERWFLLLKKRFTYVENRQA